MADSARTAGHLIGAVLESTGYHYQASILDALKSPLENEVGGLLYLIAIVMALAYTATQGSTKMASWLLIGPPLFLSVIQVRQPINNAKWEFALEKRDDAQVQVPTIKAAPNGEPQANVSSLFANYISLISDTARYMVETISQGREGADLWFMVKGQLYALMHAAEVDDPGLNALIHQSLVIDCGEVMRYARMVNDPVLVDPLPDEVHMSIIAREVNEAAEWYQPRRARAQKQFNEAYNSRRRTIKGVAAEWVAAKQAGGPATREQIQAVEAGAYSCFDIWRLVLGGILADSARMQTNIEQKAADAGIPASVIQNLQLQASGFPKDQPLVHPGTTDAQGNNTPPQLDANQVQQLHRVIALYYFRNELGNPDRGAWISWMSNRHEERNLGVEMDGTSSLTERARLAVREWGDKERLVHAAANMPYYQGVILLFLGATFPFFSLLLLIPGKHTGFLMWFVLWMWVKSWDVGFAIVMLLDDLLFATFAVDKQKFGKIKALDDPDASFLLTMGTLEELDPTFQLATYYAIIAVCLINVPMIAGQLLLGSLAQGTGLLSRGQKMFATSFAAPAYHKSVRDSMESLRQAGSEAMRIRANTTQQLVAGAARQFNAPGATPSASGGGGGSGGASSGGGGGEGAGSATGLPTRFSTDYGSQPFIDASNARLQDINRNARAGGALSGLSSSQHMLKGKDDARIDGILALAATAGGKPTALAAAKGDMARLEAVRSYVAGQIGWYSANQGELERIQRLMVVTGALPLPVSGFYDEPSAKEFEMSIQELHMHALQQNAMIEAYSMYTQQIFKMANVTTKAGWDALGGAEKTAAIKAFMESRKTQAGAAAATGTAAAGGAWYSNMFRGTTDLLGITTPTPATTADGSEVPDTSFYGEFWRGWSKFVQDGTAHAAEHLEDDRTSYQEDVDEDRRLRNLRLGR